MNTQTVTMRAVLLFAVLCGSLVFLSLPKTSSAHEGVNHATVGEAQAHLLESMRNRRASTTIDATCMAGAVETRETALASAWSELNSSIITALSDRKAALIAAWNLAPSADRTSALRTAWKEWKADKKAAHTEFRKDRKAAWDAFKKTAKDSCKMTVPKDEAQEKSEKDSVAI